MLSSNGAVIPGSFGTHSIQVQFVGNNNQADNNNFAELWPSSLTGTVWADTGPGTDTNNGIIDAGELGIANVTITLTGTTVAGTAVQQTTQTNGNGTYWFTNLLPGTYQIQKTPPAGWQDGKEMLGSVGGTIGTDLFANLQLPEDTNGVNYNFGELTPPPQIQVSSLSGYVYGDISTTGYNDGIMEPGEPGIANTLIGLTYIDPSTQKQVSLNTLTDANGFYQFTNLAPGTYTIWETTPTGWIAGKVTQGTPGNGTAYPNAITAIQLAGGVNGVNNNFGNLQPVVQGPKPVVGAAASSVPVSITPQFAPVQFFSKNLLYTTSTTAYQDPTLQAEGTWVDGMYRTLLGRPSTYQEMDYWVGQLQAGMSRQQIVAALWDTPAHYLMEVDTFYNTYLEHAPSSAAVAYWVNFLEQTHDETQMAELILSSPEYIALNGGPANYIASLYATVLQTDQIPAGALAYWQNVLNTSNNNYAAVARAFLDNPISETLVIQAYYQQILGRAPTASELNYWVNQMQTQQVSLFGLGMNLLAGDELYNIAAKAA